MDLLRKRHSRPLVHIVQNQEPNMLQNPRAIGRPTAQHIGLPRVVGTSNAIGTRLNLAKIYILYNQLDTALRYTNVALEEAESIERTESIATCYLIIGEIVFAQQNFEKDRGQGVAL